MKFGVHIDEYMKDKTDNEMIEIIKSNKEIIDKIITEMKEWKNVQTVDIKPLLK